ncbi:serine hydrolase [Aciduricibacillus chroicocephali]|uniref:Serine hydrolase n=1 Tax=Aciduricibacillus chroicocephali TaxID=3054939 RepID=A0ABY9KV38_9BACI|nr:serine hydrolase [Bacillaceae bacterium 44XB]
MSYSKQKGYLQTYFSYLKKYNFSVAYNDYEFFPTKKFPSSITPFNFNVSPNQKEFSMIEYLHKGVKRTAPFTTFMENSETNALIIIKDNSIIYEGYFNGHKRETPHKLFSITKSFVSALIGIAVEHGKIKNVDELVKTYVPEIQLKNITIKQLLQMEAGIKYTEGHFPWRDEAKVYLYPDARKLALSVVEVTNERFFHYNDYHLLLLGLVLERATGKTISEYLHANILSELGMEFPSYIIMDSEKSSFEKIESGLVMTAIDLAKFGSLYLKSGEWEGKQIIAKQWVHESVNQLNVPANMEHFNYYNRHPWGKMWFKQNKAYYKYLWWGHKNSPQNNDFFALGSLGQVLYISPENNAVAIRLGKKWGVMDWWPTILYKLVNLK